MSILSLVSTVIGLVAIATVSASGLLVLIAFTKEGLERPWLYFTGAAIFAGLMAGWYWLCKKGAGANPAGKVLLGMGLLLPAVPLAFSVLFGVQASFYSVRNTVFARWSSVTDYQETLIFWPGLGGPVGLHVEFAVRAPFALHGYVPSPKILMSGQASALLEGEAAQYWRQCTSPVSDTVHCLTRPMWPWKPEHGARAKSSARARFDLYPADLVYLEGPQRFCLTRASDTGPPSVHGGDVVALWYFGSSGFEVYLSKPLTAALRQKSVLTTTPRVMEDMRKPLQQDSLLRAGYSRCEVEETRGYQRDVSCYCR